MTYQEYKEKFNYILESIKSLDAREVYHQETGWELKWMHGRQGACPFCGSGTKGTKDSDGAFTYYQASNSFHCFACGTSADALEIVRHIHGFDFKQAVHYMAERYFGERLENPYEEITYKRAAQVKVKVWQAPSKEEIEKERQERLEKLQWLIRKAKASDRRPAEEYLRSRGIEPNLLPRNAFYALPQYENLPPKLVFLDSTETFLNSRYCSDVLPQGVGKSWNWGDKKNKIYTAAYRPQLREIYITEGVINALSIYAAGKSALSLFDSGNIPDWRILRQYIQGKDIILAGDPDPAGLKFNIELARLILSHRKAARVKILLLPEGQDANDLLQGGSLQNHLALTSNYLPLTWQEVKRLETLAQEKDFSIISDTSAAESKQFRWKAAEQIPVQVLHLLHISTPKPLTQLGIKYLEWYEKDRVRWHSTDWNPAFYFTVNEKGYIWRPFHDLRTPEFLAIDGNIPEDLIIGEMHFSARAEERRREIQAAIEVAENEKEKRKLQEKKPLERTFLTYSLLSALKLAELDEVPIALIGGKLTGEIYKSLADQSEEVYIIANYNTRERGQAKNLGLFYIDLKIYQVPRQYGTIEKMISVLQREQKLGEFYRSLNTALPMKFWQRGRGKDYEINLLSLYQFLQAHGFYTFEDKTNPKQYIYIHIDSRIVRKYADHDEFVQEVRRFLDEWLQRRGESISVRNGILKATELSEKNLAMLRRIELDFNHGTKDYQIWFFRDRKIWKATKDGIIAIPQERLEKYIWEQDILDWDTPEIKRPSRIFYSDQYQELLQAYEQERDEEKKKLYRKKIENLPIQEKYDIEILDRDNYFLQFLWLTSYLFWRDAEEQGYYIKPGDFWYELESQGILTPEKIQLMKIHLISKITWLGYIMEDYRGPEHDYGLAILDAIDLEEEGLKRDAAGGGKSLITRAIAQVKKTFFVDASRPDITTYKHRYEGWQGEKVIVLDDMHKDSRIGDMLNDFSLGISINPKHKKEIRIPLAKSPKVIITRNYIHTGEGLRVDRRLGIIYVSDYFHDSKSGKYAQDRKPKQIFGFSFFYEDTPKRRADLMNVLGWSYVEYKNWGEINTPTQELVKFRAIKEIGEQLIEYLDNFLFELYQEHNFFAPDYYVTPEKAEKILIDLGWFKSEFLIEFRDTFTRYERQKKYADSRSFKRYLRMYCELREYEFNPEDIMQLHSRDGKRIMRRSRVRNNSRGEGKTAEHIVIRVSEEDLRKWHAEAEDMNTEYQELLSDEPIEDGTPF